MAITLVDILSGEDSNSYADVTFADEYWASHFSTTKADVWNGLTSAQKESALIQACRVIEKAKFTIRNPRLDSNSLVLERGETVRLLDRRNDLPCRAVYYQALQFPRNVDVDYDTGLYYIPEPIKMAQCEQAVYLVTFDESIFASRLQGVQTDSLNMGGLSISQRFSGKPTSFAPMAVEFIGPYLLTAASRIARG
jgi:hypothetical protein